MQKQKMIRRSFWGVLLKNAAQNTLHGVFLRLQLYCHNLFKVECSLQNYKKSTTFFKYETKIQFLHSLPLHQMYAYNRKSNCKTLTKWDRILFHPVCILFSLFHQQHPNIHNIQ